MAQVDCKVVLLGSANAGKTCLLTRYLHGYFRERTEGTIGGAFAAKKEVVGKVTVTLGCWDTAGSERYATMSRMYYRKASAAIICYDITDLNSFEKARYWVSELMATEPDCRMYVCGTKLDIVNKDASKRDTDKDATRCLARDLQAGFFETSSVTGEGVEDVFKRIARDFVASETVNDIKSSNASETVMLPSWEKNGRCIAEKKSSCCIGS